ncbi:DUF397 domain-containing protein [Streptomyces sp. NPDC033538]|uniref:DUF397 domain-containing protein n=1 Tax=Streptomyces sp. NPDC033538 TaxID=3155367 RepID=UPI0034009E13
MIRKAWAEDGSELRWFKSGYSDSSNSNKCVEVATTLSAAHVRDSKNTSGPRLDPRRVGHSLAYASQH